MNKFAKITIDISNVCNAKCKWCTTGIRNRETKPFAKYMSKEEFAKVLNYCLENDIVREKADVELYSWGEPFLNPDILDILDIIVEKKMPFNLSTNASKVVILKKEHIKNLKFLMFSLSGFSQNSYGRIHGLDLKIILSNIRKMVEPFRELNMLDKVEVNFHVYQFNIGEIDACAQFCESLGIRFVPRYAYLADWNLCNAYLTDSMEVKKMKEVSKEIFFHYYDRLLEEMPYDYECPQNERIFLDTEGRVIPCACATEDTLGDIFEMTLSDIKDKKREYYRCEDCLKSGQAYVIQQYTEFLSEYDEAVENGLKYYGSKITPALYYKDFESEYSEDKKIKTSCVVRKNGEFVAKFNIADSIIVQQVRFDPCEYPCSLKNLEIFCDKIKRDYTPWNASVNKDGYLKFTTNDPIILCDVNDTIQEVVVQGIIG